MRNRDVLSEYICRKYNIELDAECVVEYVPAEQLFVASRIDLAAKLIWLQAYDTGVNVEFARELYAAHIRTITGETFVEGDKVKEKNSLQKFEEVFEKLLTDIREGGFDESISVIPVGSRNTILDGAHRVAIAYYLGLDIPITRVSNVNVDINAHWFANLYLDEKYVDYMVSRYCREKKDVYAICLWPRVTNKQEREWAEKEIVECSEVIYKKKLHLSLNGLKNFVIQIYTGHEWLRNCKEHFSGAINKAKDCWRENSPLEVFFVQADSIDVMRALKSRIRQQCGMEEHSIHITDNVDETLQIANIILNSNSLDLLQNGSPDKFSDTNLLILEYKEFLLEAGLDMERYIVDSSAVMGVYGIRNITDIDYLTDARGTNFRRENIEPHLEYARFYEQNIDELLYNPKYHLYYQNVKLITLDVLKKFKQNRHEEKDMQDVKLINNFILGKFDIGSLIYKIKYCVRQRIFRTKCKVYQILTKNKKIHNVLRRIKYAIRKNN